MEKLILIFLIANYIATISNMVMTVTVYQSMKKKKEGRIKC